MTIGNRIFLKRPACSVDLLKEFEQLPAANIADTMNRIAVLGNGIKRISSPKKPIMAGFAITVKVRAGDNLMLHAALDMAGENDVIVVSNEGDRSRAEDLDMIKGISDFQNQQVGYEAALKSYAQVQKLSLFNYIG